LEREELLLLLEEQRRRQAANNLFHYAQYVPVPGTPMNDSDECTEFYPEKLTPALHHELLLARLQDTAEGLIHHLMILMPPGSAKSSYASVVFPTWFMGRYPNKNVIMMTYGSSLAQKFGRKCRQICRSKEFEELFHSTLTGDNAAVDDWSITNASTYMCGGVMSGVTGHRGDLLVVDDPFKNREEADSPTIRDKVWEEYKSSLKTRIKPGGSEIIINTRWHEDDLSGRILPDNYDGRTGWVTSKDGEQWFVLNIPAQCERKDDPLGRAIGEYLWTEWFPVAWWEQTKRSQSNPTPRNWAALYQQRPAPDTGGIFSRDKFKLWPAKKPLPDFEYILQSWDTAFTEKTQNDYNAFTAWGLFPIGNDGAFGALLLDCWMRHMEYPELRLEALKEFRTIYGNGDGQKADVVLIEEKGSGIVLCQDLQRAGIPVRRYNPGRADKVQRANTITQFFDAGLIHLVESDRSPNKPATWTDDLVSQLCTFPNGAHDDYVDSVVQAINLLRDQRWLNVDPIPEPEEYRKKNNPYTQ